MNFCKFSTEVISSKHTMVDNVFITDFLPSAPDMAVKVYLFGLQKCLSPQVGENSLAFFAQTFGISTEDVLSIYLYWQEAGLVQVLATEPFEVRYLPVKKQSMSAKKWSEEKYESFNAQIQEVLSGRMITPNEYNEYYMVIETLKLEPNALVAIAAYCADLKGTTVGHAYITTVARVWAAEGIKTLEAVREKLQSAEQTSAAATKILVALGSKRKANIEEQALYEKWVNHLGYDDATLKQVAVMLKQSKKATFEKMDYALTKYYEAKLFTFLDISSYESHRECMTDTAKKVNKALGVWYESLDAEISEFISKWLSLGFETETLVAIATYCFKKSVRTLEGMNGVVLKFHKLGIISLGALSQYIESIATEDKQIKLLLEQMASAREVNQWDRNLYKCWTQNWHFSPEIIEFAASLSAGKAQPMQYASKILGAWFEQKVTTLADAKKHAESFGASGAKPVANKITPREYTSSELNALFDNLEEIEI